jgi:beta-glucosidase
MEPGTEEGLTPEVRSRESYCLIHPFKEGAHTLSEVAEGKITLDEFVEQLSLDDLMHLVGGQPNTGVANTFGFGNLPEYGVPSAMTADGPAGVRIAPETGILTTAFPCATLLACTWNEHLLSQVGKAGGEELKENNLAVWLTPAINIHRNPLCGRNFEYYSEDPIVAGKLAAALVNGIQSNHVGASVKHFACNNKETKRKHSDSRVSERALREIYLKAFEIVVKEAAPYTIMSAYNAINGERASESHDLLTGILREEWGYEGMVTSDWWTRGEHYKESNAGNDLKMGNGYPKRLKAADEKGALDHAMLKINAKRILSTILKFD